MIPGFVGGIYSSSRLDQSLMIQVNQENAITLEVIKEKLAHFFEEPLLELQIMKDMIEKAESPSAGFDMMSKAGHTLRYFERLTLVDGNEMIAASWPENIRMHGLNQSGKGFLNRIERGSEGYFWSETYIDYLTGKTAIDLIVPLDDGYLAGTVLLDGLQGLLDGMSENTEAIIGIVDSNGSYLAHSDGSMVEQRMKDPLIFAGNGNETPIPKEILIDAQAYLPYTEKVEGTAWTIVSYYPAEAAREPVNHVLTDFSVIQGVTLLIIALFLMLMGRIIQQQLQKIEDFTHQIAEGNYDLVEPHPTFREMGDILSSFERMAKRVQEREMEIISQNEEIFAMNEELEVRVQERTAQLETANKELEGFSYTVSHDLRAPLRHITGFVELLSKQLQGSGNEKSNHYLSVITNAATQMGQLIDDLLSFSKMGRLEMMILRVSNQALVQESLDTLGPEVSGRQVLWKISTLPDSRGDREMLRLVWVNLISNALKFTRNREQTIIEIGSKSIVHENRHETVYFVKDNGAGFDMQYAEKLFEIFQRLHRQEEFEGTGVGLANVRRIINRHGGRIWADSTLNAGAAFHFTLPVYEEDPS